MPQKLLRSEPLESNKKDGALEDRAASKYLRRDARPSRDKTSLCVETRSKLGITGAYGRLPSLVLSVSPKELQS